MQRPFDLGIVNLTQNRGFYVGWAVIFPKYIHVFCEQYSKCEENFLTISALDPTVTRLGDITFT